ncbi:HdeD family acid-resistance protein [Sulfitobacter guttiformis]|uniref:Uncharacterized membrane protein HdeD (DUF308 family) n=1 Tax=Sulfitobacter guttiformis TaxID=74349 RepID=A0A420DJ78_9RHOB|nr:DUF308 domain-containing protein [Sulfitobacter guttiformis]KIN71924.1 DUF308 domain containing protein [Sulfitobacter guttiformis KCTC 32187]RKE94269.1 uncharacterized membrane protein HdeD (DUF308 family) [Sulfitobacter guttiformis]
MTTSTDKHPFAPGIRRDHNVMVALGILMIVAGFAAIAFPFFSSLGVVWVAGVMLIIAGIAQGFSAFSFPKGGGVFLGLVVASLWLIAGFYLLMQPLEGVFILTVVVAVVFVSEGFIKTILSLQMRPLAGSGWLLFNGVVSVLFGLMLWAQLPSSALWALGTLTGMSIMISGWTLVMIPIALSKMRRNQTSQEQPL